MDINTSSYANVDWTNLATEVMQDAGLSGVTATGGTVGADGNLTLSFTGADGRTATLTMPAPELDEATGTLTEEGLDALEQKLNHSFSELQDLAENPPQPEGADTGKKADGASQMLFDIYQLMQLMLEVSKKQKELSVVARQADLERVTADIQSKASQQRAAAKTGLILSVCFSTISLAAQAATAVVSFKAQAAANRREAAVGADQAQQNMQLLSAKNTAESGANLAAAQKGLGSDPAQLQAARENFTASDAKGAEYQAAVAERDQYIQTKDAALQEATGRVDAKQAEVEACRNEIAALEEEGDNADEPSFRDIERLDELTQKRSDLTRLESELATAQNDRQALIDQAAQDDPELARLNAKVDTAREAWGNQLNMDQDQLELKLASKKLELSQLQDKENPTPAEKTQIAALESEIETLKKQAAWGKAHVVDTKMRSGDALKASLAQDIATAEHVFGQATDSLKLDAKWQAATARAKGFETASELIGRLGQALNSVTQGTTGMMEATATEYEATAKSDEAALDQSRDLVASARDLQQSILDLLRQILQAENQSINQIVA